MTYTDMLLGLRKVHRHKDITLLKTLTKHARMMGGRPGL